MGNCCRRCCRRNDKRAYLRTRYNVAHEVSVEFENLVDNDSLVTDTPQYGSAMTEYERHLLSERKFHDLVQYQIKIDAEIEEQLLKQEEQLRKDEEAFYEAKRLAAMASVKTFSGQDRNAADIDNKWTPGEDWETATGEEDFEQFLETVRSRSKNNNRKQHTDATDVVPAVLDDDHLTDDLEWTAEFVSAASES